MKQTHSSQIWGQWEWRTWTPSLLRWLKPDGSRCRWVEGIMYHRLQRQIWTGRYGCSCQCEPVETSLPVCVCVCVCVCVSASVWMSSLTLSQQSCVLFVSARRRDCQRFCFWSCLQPTEEEEGEKKGGGGERERTDNSVGWMSAEVSHCCCRRTLPETHLRGRRTNRTWKQTRICPPEVSTLHRPAHLKKNVL